MPDVGVLVRLPAMLQGTAAGAEVAIDEPVRDIAAVRAVLGRRFPALAAELDDPIYNFAVNEVMLLHGVATHPVHDGDIIDIVPTIAGG